MRQLVVIAGMLAALTGCRGGLGDACTSADGCREGLWCERGVCVSKYAELTCPERCRRFVELRAAVDDADSWDDARSRKELEACLAGCRE